jgi:CRISPR/Cas system-associated exonuclease Cas4 (RecB family)
MDFSHSKLDVARTCMLQFKFKYIDKIKGIEDKSASDFGGCMHEIIENYKGGGKEELLKMYHELVPSKYPLNDFYRKKVPLGLKNIHDIWKHVISKYDKVDDKITKKITLNDTEIPSIKKEDDIKTKLDENISLNGKIDLYIYNEGRLKIFDYKTSKSYKYANHTNQLSMYMFLLHKKYGIPYEKMDCEIIYLSLDEEKYGMKVINENYENIKKEYKLQETDVEMLISEIHTIHTAIQKSLATGKWKAKPKKFSCTYCPYKDICEEKVLS